MGQETPIERLNGLIKLNRTPGGSRHVRDLFGDLVGWSTTIPSPSNTVTKGDFEVEDTALQPLDYPRNLRARLRFVPRQPGFWSDCGIFGVCAGIFEKTLTVPELREWRVIVRPCLRPRAGVTCANLSALSDFSKRAGPNFSPYYKNYIDLQRWLGYAPEKEGGFLEDVKDWFGPSKHEFPDGSFMRRFDEAVEEIFSMCKGEVEKVTVEDWVLDPSRWATGGSAGRKGAKPRAWRSEFRRGTIIGIPKPGAIVGDAFKEATLTPGVHRVELDPSLMHLADFHSSQINVVDRGEHFVKVPLRVSHTKWAAAAATPPNVIASTIRRQNRYEGWVIDKREAAGKNRAVVCTCLPSTWQMGYVMSHLEARFANHPLFPTFYSGKVTEEFWKRWGTLRGIGTPIDQSRFDHNVSDEMIFSVLRRAARLPYGEDYQRALSFIESSLRHDTLIWCGNVAVKWAGGVASGWRMTSFLDSVINAAQFMAIRSWLLDVGLPINTQGLAFFGDDISLVLRNPLQHAAVLLAYSVAGFEVHPSKTFCGYPPSFGAPCRNEFLRYTTEGGGLISGYASRPIISCVMRAPASSPSAVGLQRLSEQQSYWGKVLGRASVPSKLIPFVLDDMSRGSGLSRDEVARLLATPSSLGGLGWFPIATLSPLSFSEDKRREVVVVDKTVAWPFEGVAQDCTRKVLAARLNLNLVPQVSASHLKVPSKYSPKLVRAAGLSANSWTFRRIEGCGELEWASLVEAFQGRTASWKELGQKIQPAQRARFIRLEKHCSRTVLIEILRGSWDKVAYLYPYTNIDSILIFREQLQAWIRHRVSEGRGKTTASRLEGWQLSAELTLWLYAREHRWMTP
jgi:hypothetical protein